ncbi:MAG: helix-turn-helix domain-containing protein, partial [Candidatus Limnocylindrales bacterium]
MLDQTVGAAIRAVRLRLGLRQSDVAARAGVARSVVSEVERGHLDDQKLAVVRRVAAALDVRVDMVARWRGGELG